jgi:colicin import membrane protein
VQLPSGDVMSAQVASCNGDDAVRRSIERAVMQASPLPKPPNPALFERNLRVTFRPDE